MKSNTSPVPMSAKNPQWYEVLPTSNSKIIGFRSDGNVTTINLAEKKGTNSWPKKASTYKNI